MDRLVQYAPLYLQVVEKATEAATRAGKAGGKFIMQPVDFLECGTPEKSVEA